jgi:hypothetical protein
MIEGHIEKLTPDGIVHGWVRDTTSPTPCHVQVLQAGQKLAEAMAAAFRPDLLRAGHGHGHYGFAARLRHALPPGPCAVALHLPRYGRTAPMGLVVPPLAPVEPASVESLLAAPPTWCVTDLLHNIACLQADKNFAGLGAARYIDAAYRFVLSRWPSKAESRLHISNLEHRRVSPQDLLRDLLTSRERADLGTHLISPFDAEFPFTFT